MTPPARRTVTMADVGAAAGVTDRTVSNVLSGNVPVSPATRDAVLRAVHELGYQMNVVARSLRTGRTGLITLAIPDLTYDYFNELAHEVMVEAEKAGWAVTIQQTASRRDRELAILAGASGQLSDGLLFQPHALGQSDLEHLAIERPIVLLGERIFGAPVDHVTMANVAAAEAATQHLIDVGRRRIAAVGVNSADIAPTAATLRLDGYRRALAAAQIPYEPRLTGEAPLWRQADGAAAVEAILDSDQEIDAVFCFNDMLAFGVIHALTQRGLRIPEDVAVVGFDNLTAARYSSPPLTTVDTGTADIARRATQILIAQIREGRSPEGREIVADFHLVRRASA